MKKKLRLYSAAEPVFERFGYRKTTVEDICKSAGMSKRTFYEFFRDKQDFFIHLLVHSMNMMMMDWKKRNSRYRNAEEKLQGYLDLYVEYCQAHPVYKLIFEETDLFYALASSMTESMLFDMNRGLAELVEAGIESGNSAFRIRRHQPG